MTKDIFFSSSALLFIGTPPSAPIVNAAPAERDVTRKRRRESFASFMILSFHIQDILRFWAAVKKTGRHPHVWKPSSGFDIVSNGKPFKGIYQMVELRQVRRRLGPGVEFRCEAF
ncbi:MAG TPA: hypothetical protein PKO36_18820, partial [Candidatus Hydrogenedentes bacterium]|nr:hypothetical protein [Candidatus Hydrogenedentota bacterium]